MAKLHQYAGPGGQYDVIYPFMRKTLMFSTSTGWNDPDLLIGPEVVVGGQTDQQARAQFSMW
jgi:hypothetical protein